LWHCDQFIGRHFPRLAACFLARTVNETRVWNARLSTAAPLSTLSVLLRCANSKPLDTCETWDTDSPPVSLTGPTTHRTQLELRFASDFSGKWQNLLKTLHKVEPFVRDLDVHLDSQTVRSIGSFRDVYQIDVHYSRLAVDRSVTIASRS
jgi:hypothetical protein